MQQVVRPDNDEDGSDCLVIIFVVNVVLSCSSLDQGPPYIDLSYDIRDKRSRIAYDIGNRECN